MAALRWQFRRCSPETIERSLIKCPQGDSGGFLFHIFSCYDCFCLSRFLLPVLERCYPKEVQELYEAMRRFARVAGPMEHDKFIESHAC